MKRWKLLVMVAMLGVTGMIFGCGRSHSEEPCGARSTRKDKRAPTSVKSSDVSSFYLYGNDASVFGGYIVLDAESFDIHTASPTRTLDEERLRAIRAAGHGVKVQVGGTCPESLDTVVPVTDAQMRQIGEAIVATGILKNNGEHGMTQGVPPDSGRASLRAAFASGEQLNIAVNSLDYSSFYLRPVAEAARVLLPIVQSYEGDASMLETVLETYDAQGGSAD
ncbi:MAG: hypothetical protein ACOYH4_03895 [Saccharofermentanales bacterium]